MTDTAVSRIVCAWSFKGGVGRSLCAAGVAFGLRDQGRRVLLIDADLEAPGLSFAGPFKNLEAGTPGFLEAALALMKGRPPDIGHIEPAGLPPATVPGGSLDFVPAGSFQERYAERLDSFSLASVFDSGREDSFFTGLREWTTGGRPRPEFVVIDLRTGLNELSLHLVHRLADLVIVVTGFNDQNLRGTRSFLEALNDRSTPTRATPVMLVASPLPSSEEKEANSRLETLRFQLNRSPDAVVRYHPLLALSDDLASIFAGPLPSRLGLAEVTRAVRRYLGVDAHDLFEEIAQSIEADPKLAARRAAELWILDQQAGIAVLSRAWLRLPAAAAVVSEKLLDRVPAARALVRDALSSAASSLADPVQNALSWWPQGTDLPVPAANRVLAELFRKPGGGIDTGGQPYEEATTSAVWRSRVARTARADSWMGNAVQGLERAAKLPGSGDAEVLELWLARGWQAVLARDEQGTEAVTGALGRSGDKDPFALAALGGMVRLGCLEDAAKVLAAVLERSPSLRPVIWQHPASASLPREVAVLLLPGWTPTAPRTPPTQTT